MKASLFDYHLPFEKIAQRPLARRDASRMLVLDRKTGRLEHSLVRELPKWLLPGDLIVLNETKVIPARLFAVKPETGAHLEIFLLRKAVGGEVGEWEALINPAKRVKSGMTLRVLPKGEAEVLEALGEGHFLVRFPRVGDFGKFLEEAGHVPLPPYIKRHDTSTDRQRYQCVFAREEGSVAAPTAGLHFTRELLGELGEKGAHQASVTLHVGLGTFLPVTEDEIENHVMHPENFEVPKSTASAVRRTKSGNGRVVAIGTTVVRALESAVGEDGKVSPLAEETRLFIGPGYGFKAVDVLFTNFHQPRSTLLMLVCAFAGRERVLAAYEEALREGYRFLSYGDAMLIL